MIDWISQPWPWYVGGPIIGLVIPLLLLAGGKMFGISSSLRHACAALIPGKIEFFQYDWRKVGTWNLTFALGIILGGAISSLLLNDGSNVAISASTVNDLKTLGINNFDGLVPNEVFSWGALVTVRGFVSLVIGGFLIGFGARYAGGCTSGHGVSGIAALQLPSLIAALGFFAGGLFTTFVILPLLF